MIQDKIDEKLELIKKRFHTNIGNVLKEWSKSTELSYDKDFLFYPYAVFYALKADSLTQDDINLFKKIRDFDTINLGYRKNAYLDIYELFLNRDPACFYDMVMYCIDRDYLFEGFYDGDGRKMRITENAKLWVEKGVEKFRHNIKQLLAFTQFDKICNYIWLDKYHVLAHTGDIYNVEKSYDLQQDLMSRNTLSIPDAKLVYMFREQEVLCESTMLDLVLKTNFQDIMALNAEISGEYALKQKEELAEEEEKLLEQHTMLEEIYKCL